jgi:hypothetical protein
MSAQRLGSQLARLLSGAATDGARAWLRSRSKHSARTPAPTPATREPRGGAAAPSTGRRSGPALEPSAAPSGAPAPWIYPGDFQGIPDISYEPAPDGDPDPGEIVWTWVPYEEDHGRGKDRPVLVIGRDGAWLLALMLTSRDHDRDAADEQRRGRQWMDIGTGPWDRRGRPSEVRLDRVIRVDPAGVRREGAVLDSSRFEQVAAGVRAAT